MIISVIARNGNDEAISIELAWIIDCFANASNHKLMKLLRKQESIQCLSQSTPSYYHCEEAGDEVIVRRHEVPVQPKSYPPHGTSYACCTSPKLRLAANFAEFSR